MSHDRGRKARPKPAVNLHRTEYITKNAGVIHDYSKECHHRQ